MLLHSAIRALGKLPLSLRRGLGSAGGTLFSLVPTRERKIARMQMQWHLKIAQPPIAKLYRHFGQVALECCNLQELLKLRSKTISNLEEARAYFDSWNGGPVLALSAHTGNWELVAALSASRCKLNVIGQKARIADLQEALSSFRSGVNVGVIWRDERGGAKRILEKFRAGEAVAALIDQDTDVRSGSYSFFGQPVRVPDTMIEMAQRVGARITTVFSVRERDGRYRFITREHSAKDTVGEIVASYNQLLEETLRAYPEQWVWFHKRWRSVSPEVRLSGQQYMNYLTQAVRRQKEQS